MKNVLLFVFLFLLQGCSLHTLFLSGELNTVHIVKHKTYLKHHRAYFERISLQKIKGKKYLFLHNKKTNDLAVLFHTKKNFTLYNMSKTKQAPLTLKSNTTRATLRELKRKGFSPVRSFSSLGYIVKVAPRRYKGIKTFLIETKEYTKLQKLYKNAIKKRNFKLISHIKTTLPQSLIHNYYKHNRSKVHSGKDIQQLEYIAKKLNFKTTTRAYKKIHNKEQILQKPINDLHSKKILNRNEDIISPSSHKAAVTPNSVQTSEKQYNYYLTKASLSELSSYISRQATKNALSYNQYTMLKQRKVVLKEEELLRYGSIEELISAYKINKNNKYKNRIMLLMKKKQESN